MSDFILWKQVSFDVVVQSKWVAENVAKSNASSHSSDVLAMWNGCMQ